MFDFSQRHQVGQRGHQPESQPSPGADLAIAIFVALAVVSTQYPALVMQGNSANFWWILAWFAGLIVAGALLYYIPRFVRARRGINVSFVYKELPPE